MLITLSLDTSDRPAIDRGLAIDKLGHTLAELISKGFTGEVRLTDLDAITTDDTADEDNPTTQYTQGYTLGFRHGVEHAMQVAQTLPRVELTLSPIDSEDPDTDPDIPTIGEPAAERDGRGLPAIAEWVEPDPTPPPTHAPMRTIEDFMARQKEIQEADAAAEATENQLAGEPQTQPHEPAGERPPMNDDAPVLSAYDDIGAKFAHEVFGFPEFPDHARPWKDPEGATWVYDSNIREWNRRDYPTRWHTPTDPGLLTHPDGGRDTSQ